MRGRGGLSRFGGGGGGGSATFPFFGFGFGFCAAGGASDARVGLCKDGAERGVDIDCAGDEKREGESDDVERRSCCVEERMDPSRSLEGILDCEAERPFGRVC